MEDLINTYIINLSPFTHSVQSNITYDNLYNYIISHEEFDFSGDYFKFVEHLILKFYICTDSYINKELDEHITSLISDHYSSINYFTRQSVFTSYSSLRKELISKIMLIKDANFLIAKNIINGVFLQIRKSTVKPQSYVGIIAGSAMTANQTQKMLSHFHTAGLSDNSDNNSTLKFGDIIACTSNTFKSVTSFKFKKPMLVDNISMIYKDIIYFKYGDVIDVTHKLTDGAVRFIIKSDLLYKYKIPIDKLLMNLRSVKGSFSISVQPGFLAPEISITWECKSEINNIDIIYNTHLCGIKNISGIIELITEKNMCYGMKVKGSNISDLSKIPYIDNSTIISDSINDIYLLYGIEMTRRNLIHVIEESIFNPYPPGNNNHINLLSNTMCVNGEIIPVSKKGFKLLKHTPLSSMSFEYPMIELKQTAYQIVDDLSQISSKIIVGSL